MSKPTSPSRAALLLGAALSLVAFTALRPGTVDPEGTLRLVRAHARAEGLGAAPPRPITPLRSFAEHATYQAGLSSDADPHMVEAAVVPGGYFRATGVAPALGRVLEPGDDCPRATPALVLSEAAWRERFGADPAVLGRVVTLNGRAFTVVGVAPARGGTAPLGWIAARAWAQVEGGAYVRVDAEGEPGTG